MKRFSLMFKLLLINVLAVLTVGHAQAETQIGQDSGHISFNGWEIDYDMFQLSDGLNLKNVTYNGVQILARANFPVMSVYYEGNCGPYADRLNGPRRSVPWAGNTTLVAREFTQAGRQWFELGIREFIGSYDIYQSWYIGSEGELDGHLFSRGLQCNYDHVHYPMWRLDFDIDGAGNDQIVRENESGQRIPYSTEFQTNATDAYQHRWFVEDTVSGQQVRIDFDSGAWNVGGTVQPQTAYAQNLIGGVVARNNQEGWSGGASRDFPYRNNESLVNQDIALWYRGYLPHTPEEGSALWHSTGFRITANLDSDPDGDGLVNSVDPDDDNDNVNDEQDAFPLDPTEWSDSDGDGIGDNADPVNPGPMGCNILENGSLDFTTAAWSGTNTTLSIVPDAAQGAGALSFGNGSASTRAQATENTSYVISGFTKGPDGNGWAGLGVDFIDSNGIEISEVVHTISPSAGYSSFAIEALSPPGTASVHLWIHASSERTITVDSLDIHAIGCNGEEEPVDPPVGPNPPPTTDEFPFGESQFSGFAYCDPADTNVPDHGWGNLSNYLVNGLRPNSAGCIFPGGASDNPFGDPARGYQPAGDVTPPPDSNDYPFGESQLSGYPYCDQRDSNIPDHGWGNLSNYTVNGVALSSSGCIHVGGASDNPFGDPARGYQPVGTTGPMPEGADFPFGESQSAGTAYCDSSDTNVPDHGWGNLINYVVNGANLRNEGCIYQGGNADNPYGDPGLGLQ